MRLCVGLWGLALLAAPALGESGGVIRGVAADRESGAPLPGAHVLLLRSAIAGVCDSSGVFLLRGVPAGEEIVRVSHVGYAAADRHCLVAAGDTSFVIVLLVATPIPGQPVTVTATRGVARETPVTFSMLEREDLRDRYTVQDLPVLLSELPSATYYSESGNGIGYTYLTLRGFDARRVSVMVNGIPQNDPEDHNVYWLDMPDLTASLEDVQVQRGAGSAFYGSPAIGGSVNCVTRALGRESSAEVSIGGGAYDTRRYSAALSSGIVGGRYAFHARLSRILSDGYREKSWVDFAGYFFGAVRYDETMTTELHFYGGPVSDGLAYYGIPKSDVRNRERRRDNPIARPEELENFSQPHFEILHEWRPAPGVTVNNTLFLIHGDGFFDYDGSWAPIAYFRLTPEYGFPDIGDPLAITIPDAIIHAGVSNRQYGWLPRVTVQHAGGTTIVGGELRIHRSLHWGELRGTPGLPAFTPAHHRYYEYRGGKEILSLYAHSLLDLTPGMKVMADLQYAYNRYRLYDERYVGTDFAAPYHFVNPRLGVNLNLDERWHLYLSGAYTSREPRLKNLYDAAESSTPDSWGRVLPQFAPGPGGRYDFTQPLVKPESLFDLEFGAGLNTDRLRGTLNLYWMEFTNEIVKSGRIDRFGQPVTGNAARTRHVGAEVSVRARLNERWEVSAAASVSRNRFIRHTDFAAGGPVVLDGNPIAGFPDLLGNLRGTYREGGFTVSLAGRFLGKQYTDNYRNQENTVDPFTVWDATLACAFPVLPGGGTVEGKLQVNNLFDALYAAYGEGAQFFVGAERHFTFTMTVIY